MVSAPWLLGGREPVALGMSDIAPRGVTVITVVGAVLALTGWSDIALLWYPARLGTPEWEFGAVAQTVEGLPLGTVGLLLLALAVIARDSARGMAFALSALCGLVTLGLLGCAVLFGLDLPQALRALNDPQIGPGLKRVIAKTVLFLAAYLVAYLTMSVVLWRHARNAPRAT